MLRSQTLFGGDPHMQNTEHAKPVILTDLNQGGEIMRPCHIDQGRNHSNKCRHQHHRKRFGASQEMLYGPLICCSFKV